MKELGLRIAGVAGAVMATFGCILPSLLIVSLLARIYYRHQWGRPSMASSAPSVRQ